MSGVRPPHPKAAILLTTQLRTFAVGHQNIYATFSRPCIELHPICSLTLSPRSSELLPVCFR